MRIRGLPKSRRRLPLQVEAYLDKHDLRKKMEEALNTLQKDALFKEMECFGLDNKSFLKRKANTPKNKIVTALLRGVNKKVQSSRP